ncbi:hypothetical protein AURDEDRAFT_52313 [Auricularia subglabra TFB-10046 SS5]|nr:hypothetical protein AURDEDRAFT_52313 [Auricularia subglabra TFB-10046 SS5]
MPDWSDPVEIARDAGECLIVSGARRAHVRLADAFGKLIFALFGLYFWEVLITSPFDWEVISRQRPFRLPLVLFYFLTRYSLFWALIGLMITINVSSEVCPCLALYTFCQWAGNTAIAGASTCLMLRTIAIWKRKMFMVVPLVALSLGQWALLYYAIISVKAVWVEEQGVCSVTGASSVVLNVIYFYTMSFDLIILIASTIGLLSLNARSGIWNLLFKDGILFFAVAFSANAVPAVLNVLNLNRA